MGIVYFRVRARVRVKVGVRVDSSEIYLTAHLSQHVMHTEPQKWLRSAQLSLVELNTNIVFVGTEGTVGNWDNRLKRLKSLHNA